MVQWWRLVLRTMVRGQRVAVAVVESAGRRSWGMGSLLRLMPDAVVTRRHGRLVVVVPAERLPRLDAALLARLGGRLGKEVGMAFAEVGPWPWSLAAAVDRSCVRIGLRAAAEV